ncbi:MAG TPA: hypothetical protein VMR18_01820 [Candidatus Saccharimonadales bacterium]|nr:hypothetical protein [Candidatus Saccharimonadales bacterium]
MKKFKAQSCDLGVLTGVVVRRNLKVEGKPYVLFIKTGIQPLSVALEAFLESVARKIDGVAEMEIVLSVQAGVRQNLITQGSANMQVIFGPSIRSKRSAEEIAPDVVATIALALTGLDKDTKDRLTQDVLAQAQEDAERFNILFAQEHGVNTVSGGYDS